MLVANNKHHFQRFERHYILSSRGLRAFAPQHISSSLRRLKMARSFQEAFTEKKIEFRCDFRWNWVEKRLRIFSDILPSYWRHDRNEIIFELAMLYTYLFIHFILNSFTPTNRENKTYYMKLIKHIQKLNCLSTNTEVIQN